MWVVVFGVITRLGLVFGLGLETLESNTSKLLPYFSPSLLLGNSSLPICFSTHEMRLKDLAGEWVRVESSPHYWNLSCAAEWSKYSCVHQGGH